MTDSKTPITLSDDPKDAPDEVKNPDGTVNKQKLLEWLMQGDSGLGAIFGDQLKGPMEQIQQLMEQNDTSQNRAFDTPSHDLPNEVQKPTEPDQQKSPKR